MILIHLSGLRLVTASKQRKNTKKLDELNSILFSIAETQQGNYTTDSPLTYVPSH